jgi:GT2 family glycosyltransferase
MKCHVVVVNWNGHDDTDHCLESFCRHHSFDMVITVIDNSENHAPLKFLESKYPNVRFVYNQSNVGFAAACNQAMKFSWALECEIVHFLNNDTVVLGPYVFDSIRLFTECDNVVATSPCVNYFHDSGQSWFCNSSVNEQTGEVIHIQTKPNQPSYLVPWLSGCSLLVRSRVFLELGGFDESLFMYCEDVDFSFKCRNAGYDLAVTSGVGLLHKVSASAAKVSMKSLFYDVRNKLVICRKYFRQQYGFRPFVQTVLRELRYVLSSRIPTTLRLMRVYVVGKSLVSALRFPLRSNP